MLWASLFCTVHVDGLTTVYFINNEVDLAVNEIIHQLHAVSGYNIIIMVTIKINERINYRSSAINQGSVIYFLQFLQYQEFITSLSICSQVSCLQLCQRQLLNLSNDSCQYTCIEPLCFAWATNRSSWAMNWKMVCSCSLSRHCSLDSSPFNWGPGIHCCAWVASIVNFVSQTPRNPRG